MAKRGYGFLDGLMDGIAMGDELETAKQKRKGAELEQKRLGFEVDRQERTNKRELDRENDLRGMMVGSSNDPTALNYENSMDTGGSVVKPQAAMSPFDALIGAASKRLAAGDVDGYTDMLTKGTAAKTMYFTQKFNDAYRSGDANGMLGLLNEFPDGNKYSIKQMPDGKIAATLSSPDGAVLGSVPFNSVRELGAFIQDRINPGDIAKKVREEMEAKTKERVAEANIAQSSAASAASNFQVQRGTQLLPGELVHQAATTEASNANAAQSRASAAASAASAELHRAQVPGAGMGPMGKQIADMKASGLFSDEDIKGALGSSKGKSREEAITATATAMAKEAVNAGMTADQLVAKATAIVDGAAKNAGRSKVGSGPGINKGNLDPIAMAKDAIARGAPRERVIERLKQSGIDPKGL